MRTKKTTNSSIRPSIFHMAFFAATLSTSSSGTLVPVPGHIRCLIPPGSSGSARVLLPDGGAWKTPRGRRPRGTHLREEAKGQRFHSELPLDVRALSPATLTHFSRLYQWSFSFGHFTKDHYNQCRIVVDQIVNGSLCLHLLSITIQPWVYIYICPSSHVLHLPTTIQLSGPSYQLYNTNKDISLLIHSWRVSGVVAFCQNEYWGF